MLVAEDDSAAPILHTADKRFAHIAVPARPQPEIARKSRGVVYSRECLQRAIFPLCIVPTRKNNHSDSLEDILSRQFINTSE